MVVKVVHHQLHSYTVPNPVQSSNPLPDIFKHLSLDTDLDYLPASGLTTPTGTSSTNIIKLKTI
jgi:hypothetical protein